MDEFWICTPLFIGLSFVLTYSQNFGRESRRRYSRRLAQCDTVSRVRLQ